jgi:hypothetical protein
MPRTSNLKGYEIDDTMEHVVTTLFADDTTVYLRDTDSFEELQRILDKWCLASSARFNVAKTEVIPIGIPEYRLKVVETRKLNDDDTALPDNVHIAAYGESIRILGARV